MKRFPVIRNFFYPAALVLIFVLLTVLMIPKGCVFGSHMDWLSQHAALAETIRNACLEQHTLLPDWLSLGGGVNGYQFSYYGFLRPDILIGYMLSVGMMSVLLCFFWLKSEELPSVFAFAGSIIFLTAGCLFHLHRQVMFVNYLPFLLLSFLSIRKRQTKWLPLCLCLIWLNSFYYVLSILLAIGWYWYQTEGREFLKVSFLKRYIPSVLLSASMAGALLLPTGLVLLEHRRSGSIQCRTGTERIQSLYEGNLLFCRFQHQMDPLPKYGTCRRRKQMEFPFPFSLCSGRDPLLLFRPGIAFGSGRRPASHRFAGDVSRLSLLRLFPARERQEHCPSSDQSDPDAARNSDAVSCHSGTVYLPGLHGKQAQTHLY